MTTVKLTTNHGDLVIRLFIQKAPRTVANFVDYVQSGFYNGTLFHRCIKGFMVQGGRYAEGMTAKETTRGNIINEADSGLMNMKYTVAMSRGMEPHSATSAFFINTADNDLFNHSARSAQGWGYAVFGEVIEGREVVDIIEAVTTESRGNHENVPKVDVVLEEAKLIA